MKRNNKGQSLFEILFAVAIMALIGVAIVSLSVSSVRNNIFANNKTLANKYNVEAQEWLRAERDENFHSIWSKSGQPAEMQYCLNDLTDSNWFNNHNDCEDDENISDTVFYRELYLTRIDLETTNSDVESILAKVIVKWTDAQGTHEVVSETYLTDWRNSL